MGADLMRDVDALIALAARRDRADFEAALYRGSREYRAAHAAEEAFLEARAEFERKWAPGPEGGTK